LQKRYDRLRYGSASNRAYLVGLPDIDLEWSSDDEEPLEVSPVNIWNPNEIVPFNPAPTIPVPNVSAEKEKSEKETVPESEKEKTQEEETGTEEDKTQKEKTREEENANVDSGGSVSADNDIPNLGDGSDDVPNCDFSSAVNVNEKERTHSQTEEDKTQKEKTGTEAKE
jgi:hypothetical protein